jgi:hypothetical protein
MIKEEKPTGFSEINLKIFWKNILINHSLFTIHHSLHMISLLKTSTTSKDRINNISGKSINVDCLTIVQFAFILRNSSANCI